MPPPQPRAVGDGSVLRLVVQGFDKMERSLLEGTVRLSQRRTPRLELLDASRHAEADVVMIDTRDEAAMAWARATSSLRHKPVIWVDGTQAGAGHTLAKRPIQWPILPMSLARALEAVATRPEPAAKPAAPADGAMPADVRPQAAVAPILVVDDSLAVRAHMRSILERLGYTVEEAVSAQAALHAVAHGRYALVFMDVLMPELDGYEACKRIKAQQRTLGIVPIVMLTSRNSPFDRIRGKMSGCDGYLTKPADTAALQDVLLRFAGRPGARQAQVPSMTPSPPIVATAPVPLALQPAPPAPRSPPVLTNVLLSQR